MKMIHEKIENICEELEDALEYAEKYMVCKARGNLGHANKFKEMAHDELNHANMLHELYTADIEELNKVYTLTEEEEKAWEHCHKHFAEKVAMVRHILSM